MPSFKNLPQNNRNTGNGTTLGKWTDNLESQLYEPKYCVYCLCDTQATDTVLLLGCMYV